MFKNKIYLYFHLIINYYKYNYLLYIVRIIILYLIKNKNKLLSYYY